MLKVLCLSFYFITTPRYFLSKYDTIAAFFKDGLIGRLQGKRMCGLGKCYDKGIEKHKIWVSLSVFMLNARQLMRDMDKNKKLAAQLMGF